MTYLINTPSQLGLALKSARKSLGLTQAEAAARVGILPKTISALENHAESCTIESLLKFLSVLELEMAFAPKNEIPKEDRPKARSHKREDLAGW